MDMLKVNVISLTKEKEDLIKEKAKLTIMYDSLIKENNLEQNHLKALDNTNTPEKVRGVMPEIEDNTEKDVELYNNFV